MEHSLLHALQLLGLISALGGGLFQVLILRPALLTTQIAAQTGAIELEKGIARWVAISALAAAVAGGLNVFVQVAELEGGTVYQGVSLALIKQYLLATTVGNFVTAKIAFLLVAAVLAWSTLPGKWFLCAGASAGAVVSASLVSHAAALPTSRGVALAAQMIHLGAAALWLGMLAQLWLAAKILNRDGREDAFILRNEIFRRFSPFALFGVTLLALSGLYFAYRFVRAPGAMLTSAYGLTLSLKLLLLMFALAAGYRNWRFVRPAILRAKGETAVALGRFRRLAELELSAGLLVVALAGIVGSISPPGVDGSSRLDSSQIAAMISPELPSVKFIDPDTFVGAESRNEQDLRYAEFTHRWSGVLVALLGMFWLGQSAGSERVRKLCGSGWPLLLLPFGFFIAIFADPEPWLMGQGTVRELLRSPEIIEHQLGAALVFILVALGLRDRKRAAGSRPLGYALPVIMILGSLMLLGHAHSSLRASEELSSLINAQHAILGGFGLMAGFVRWLQLRGIFERPWARMAWPMGIAALGVAMAFFYTELV